MGPIHTDAEIAGELEGKFALINALIHLGQAAYRYGDYPKAWRHFEQGLSHLTVRDSKKLRVMLDHGLGRVSIGTGTYKRAQSFLDRKKGPKMTQVFDVQTLDMQFAADHHGVVRSGPNRSGVGRVVY